MKVKKLALLLVLLLVSGVFVFAEEENVFSKYDQSLGFYGNSTGMMGISYQDWNGRLGYQVTGGFTYSDDYAFDVYSYDGENVPVDIFSYNIGAEVFYMLYEDSYDDWLAGALYVFGNLTHIGSINTDITFTGTTITPTEGDPYTEYSASGETDPYFTPGIGLAVGVGFEIVLFDHFSIPVEVGYGGAWEFSSIVPVNGGFMAGGGFRYRY